MVGVVGSFAAQQYVLDHSSRIAGLVLSGTAVIDLLEPALDLDARSSSGFNAPFPSRTGFEWLSRDDAQVDACVADRFCGFGLDSEGARPCKPGRATLPTPVDLRASARTCRCT